MRNVKHGFWDEEYGARVDAQPALSAEDEFFSQEQPQFLCSHEDLYEAMQGLTTRQAFVVRLYYGLVCEPWKMQEIADIFGWHHSTVQKHLDMAHKKLRTLLEARE